MSLELMRKHDKISEGYAVNRSIGVQEVTTSRHSVFLSNQPAGIIPEAERPLKGRQYSLIS